MLTYAYHAIGHMEIWFLWRNKTRFIPSCSCVHTTVWMHHMDVNNTNREKARWELRKNTACYLEQDLEAVFLQAAVVRPPASYLTNHSSKTKKTCRAQRENQERANKRCSLLADQQILTSTPSKDNMLSRRPFRSDHHHHHHIVLAARISLTLSRHSSLSFIALGRSSGQHPVSSHSCWMYVRAGRPAFARPCVGIHKSTSLMSSSLLLQQCPACLFA